MTTASHIFPYRRLSAAPCNKIIILKSLRTHETDSADYLYRHITESVNQERLLEGELPATPVQIKLESKRHFFDLLADIKKECTQGVSPIIHLETHGSKGQGLVIFPCDDNHEIVTWDELIDQFREINIACSGNLTVILAACHSFEIERKILKQQRASPFFALIGYESKILLEDIELDLAFLYDSLLLENTLPYDNDNPMEKYTLYTEYSLALSLIGVVLGNLSSPGSAEGLIPTFEQFSAPPYPLSHLPLEMQIELFETCLKSEHYVQTLADAFMQNRQNAQLLKQDISEYFKSHFANEERLTSTSQPTVHVPRRT